MWEIILGDVSIKSEAKDWDLKEWSWYCLIFTEQLERLKAG